MSSDRRTYPHIFLDTNAIVRLGVSLSHHLLSPNNAFSRTRIAMEEGVIRVSTHKSLLNRAQEIISDKLQRKYGFEGVLCILGQLSIAVDNGWVEVIGDETINMLDENKLTIYNKLASSWRSLIETKDPEDADMLEHAALAFTKNCVIRTREEYYVPSYFVIVSNDTDVHRCREALDQITRTILASLKIMELVNLKIYGIERLISIITWREFTDLVRCSFST